MKILQKIPDNSFKASSTPKPMTPNDALMACVFGCMGGLIRSMISLLNSKVKKKVIIWKYWMISTTVSGIVGAFMGIVLGFGLAISFLAGYAGLDIIDGIYKTFKSQKVIVKSE